MSSAHSNEKGEGGREREREREREMLTLTLINRSFPAKGLSELLAA
jgi:hypothetical protein